MSNLRGIYQIIVCFDSIESHNRYFCGGGYTGNGYLSSNHGEAYRCSIEEAERLSAKIKSDWPACTDVKFEKLDNRT